MRKTAAAGVALLSLILGLMVPTAAQGATTFNSTASSGATAEIGGSITTETGVEPQAAGTYNEVLTQTWPAGRGGLGDVNAPGQWSLEYLVSGSWLTSRPTDSNSINGVRASGELVSEGINTGDQILKSTVAAGPGKSSAALIPSAGRGDGWGVTLTPNYILNVYHHGGAYELECVSKETYSLCDPTAPYTVSGFSTSNLSDVSYYDGKAYSLVLNTTTHKPSVICTNVASLPFSPCTLPNTDLTAAVDVFSSTGDLSAQHVLGTKLYGVDFVNSQILCFNMATETECTATPVADLSRSNEYSPGFLSIIENKLFIAANAIYCYDLAVSPVAACAGWPPVNSYSAQNVIPAMDSTGTTIEGVCSIRADQANSVPAAFCFNFDGTTRTVPTGLEDLASGTSTRFSGGQGYFETRAWIGSKVYWSSNPSGDDWDTNTATCYDWAIDAACLGFSTTTSIGDERYAMVVDPYNTNCIWTNGDSGAISSFDATTGMGGCTPVGVANLEYDAPLSCSSTGAVKGFEKLTVYTIPGILLADIRVNLFTSEGTEIAGFQNITPDSVTGEVDLTTLVPADATDMFYFELSAANATQEELEQLSGALTYTAEAAQLCVTISPILASCPSDLTGLTTIPQSDFAIVSSASIAIGAGSPTVENNTDTFGVTDATVLNCYFWSALGDGSAEGLNPNGSSTGITDMAWDEDGVIYIGGYFQNAGGDPAADNLARWGQNGWEAVAPVDATTSAVSGRVMTLAFTSSGKLLVGGNFNNVNGIDTADYFAMLDPDTNVWTAAGNDENSSAFTGGLRDIVVDEARGKIYVAGTFSGKIAAIDMASNEVSAVGVGNEFNGNINVLEMGPDGKLYVGGSFNAFGGFTNRRAAVWDGSAWGQISASQSDSTFNDQVWSFAFAENKVYVSGNFNGIMQLEIDQDAWSEVTDSSSFLAGTTRSLIVSSSGDLYASGRAYGTDREFFARFHNGAWESLLEIGLINAVANTNSCSYDWCGSWNVAEDPKGQIWFGGDFADVANKDLVDNLAVWGPTAASSIRYVPYVAPTKSRRTVEVPVVLPKAVSLTKRLYFKGDSFVLSASTKMALKKLAANLKTKQDVKISIHGYVLTKKVTAFDRKLSKNRALAIAKYLRKLGLNVDFEIKAVGKAPEQSNKARRVELKANWLEATQP